MSRLHALLHQDPKSPITRSKSTLEVELRGAGVVGRGLPQQIAYQESANDWSAQEHRPFGGWRPSQTQSVCEIAAARCGTTQYRLWRDPVGTTLRGAALRFTTRICGNGSF